ncbi:MAG: anti-sigma regulatory factor [Latescibacteria bacterium DG_63]|nr:MAG: anti-sigma regulatory factor [Latescibacteria bacterium DG_63]
MTSENGLSQVFEITGRDFNRAGTISTKIKEILQEIGIAPSIIRRAAIAAYEAEMNIVMYADRGKVLLTLTPTALRLDVDDEGPGIEDIELAMQEGFSTATDEMREMGFGAGMGLPNIKKNADEFEISSKAGEGTSIDIVLYLNQEVQ